jgi:hypothetical protein
LGRPICAVSLAFQPVSIHSQQIQRFHNNRVMRAPQGAAGENRIARAKLSPDWGVIGHLIGALRTRA